MVAYHSTTYMPSSAPGAQGYFEISKKTPTPRQIVIKVSPMHSTARLTLPPLPYRLVRYTYIKKALHIKDTVETPNTK